MKIKNNLSCFCFWADYRDYIQAARYLEMNLNDTKVKTPHDFKYCHDLCCARREELAKKRQAMKKALKC